MLFNILKTLAALSLLIGAGVVHGMWTDRWSTNEHVQTAVERLQQVPRSIANWQGTDSSMDEETLVATGAAGYLHRLYVNRQSGQVVDILILAGRPGPVSIHTPDVCYVGAGYTQYHHEQYQLTWAADQPAAGLAVGDFKKGREPDVQLVRVFWTWGAEGQWAAPSHPRLVYAKYHALYKMYVSSPLSNEHAAVDQDPALDFVRVLMPELQKHLFGRPGTVS